MYAVLQWDKKYCDVCRTEVTSGGFEAYGKHFCSQKHAEQYEKERLAKVAKPEAEPSQRSTER